MNRPFDTVVIIGVGLVGGSLGIALRGLPDAPHVIGIDADADTRSWAVEHGVVGEAFAPDSPRVDVLLGAGGAGLVVLATPVQAAVGWLGRLGALAYDGVVTDVASTKSAVFLVADMSLGEEATFIGGHPMAGSERSGVRAAKADLFKGAYYVLTPSSRTDPDAYRRLHALVTSVGARVIAIRPEQHDEAVAVISHVPHVAAAALTNLAAERADAGEDVLRLAAGGFKDMTRIAAGSPELWTGICMDNRDALVRGLREYAELLTRFAILVDAGDSQGIREWLARAADVRKGLPARWVPASERLSVLTVPITDRPGMVASVVQAAARCGCNIEDIEIDHTTEDTALLRLVLTDEGDAAALVTVLAGEGFSPDLRPLESPDADAIGSGA
ncbi:MAG: prephenate dehydrogenase/arogenate dehydrogenase family protein [Coriobacteriia bacterium]|nr:prephenate dehydrogenase/arogenate dehydrogenase family protein [Coriobacteriia bacterium]